MLGIKFMDKNNYWHEDKNANWDISLSGVKKQIADLENVKNLHNEAISVVYNIKTDNIHIITTDDRAYKIPVDFIEELKNVPKNKLRKLELFSFPDSAIHLDSLDINISLDSLIELVELKHQAI